MLLREIKRNCVVYKLFEKPKKYGRKFPEKYEEAIKGKTIDDLDQYIKEEADRHPDINWGYITEEYLPIRADELTAEFLSYKWWAKAIIKFAPKNIAAAFIEGSKEITRKNYYENMFGEVLCEEKNGEDIVLFNLRAISQKWDLHDFNCTADLKIVAQSIVKHEFRHAKQIRALRDAGGPELVLKAFSLKRKMTYGSDPMEWDAYMYQIGKVYDIEDFIKEVKEA